MNINLECLPNSEIEIDKRLLSVTAEYVNSKRMNLKTAKRLLSDELKNKCDFENHTWALFLVLVNV